MEGDCNLKEYHYIHSVTKDRVETNTLSESKSKGVYSYSINFDEKVCIYDTYKKIDKSLYDKKKEEFKTKCDEENDK